MIIYEVCVFFYGKSASTKRSTNKKFIENGKKARKREKERDGGVIMID